MGWPTKVNAAGGNTVAENPLGDQQPTPEKTEALKQTRDKIAKGNNALAGTHKQTVKGGSKVHRSTIPHKGPDGSQEGHASNGGHRSPPQISSNNFPQRHAHAPGNDGTKAGSTQQNFFAPPGHQEQSNPAGGATIAPNREPGSGWHPLAGDRNHSLGGGNTARGSAQDTGGAGQRKGTGEGWGHNSGVRSSQGRAETGSGQRAPGHGRVSGGQQAPNHTGGGQRASSHSHASGAQQASSHGHTGGSQHASAMAMPAAPSRLPATGIRAGANTPPAMAMPAAPSRLPATGIRAGANTPPAMAMPAAPSRLPATLI